MITESNWMLLFEMTRTLSPTCKDSIRLAREFEITFAVAAPPSGSKALLNCDSFSFSASFFLSASNSACFSFYSARRSSNSRFFSSLVFLYK